MPFLRPGQGSPLSGDPSSSQFTVFSNLEEEKGFWPSTDRGALPSAPSLYPSVRAEKPENRNYYRC